jgi:homogentisate 1,2-dioxygenase
MNDRAFTNADGDLLFVPQLATMHLQTEMGCMTVAPGEIAVVQRGIRFRVVVDGESRGYCLEVFNGHFEIPDLGPIGANGLAK